MLIWLQNNLFTILICAVLVAFFGWMIYSLIRDRRKGKSSCCGGCAGCAMAGHCHPQAAKPADPPSDTSKGDGAASPREVRS